MNKAVEITDIGFKDYKETWDLQENLFQNIIEIKSKMRRENLQLVTPNYFLFVEHPHVYTLGKSGHIENLLISEEKLHSIGAKYYKINRGGGYNLSRAGSNCGLSYFGFGEFLYRYL